MDHGMGSEKIAYLAQIQGVINRMSTAALACKGFIATIFAAVVAIVLSGGGANGVFALAMSLVPVALFAFFDMYYFAKELQYRDVYSEVLSDKHEVDFDMRVGKVESRIRSRVVKSISIWPFYLVFLFAYLVVFVVLIIDWTF